MRAHLTESPSSDRLDFEHPTCLKMATIVPSTYHEVTHFYDPAYDSDDGLASDQEWASEIEVSSTSLPPGCLGQPHLRVLPSRC
jgi:hypothetical protein